MILKPQWAWFEFMFILAIAERLNAHLLLHNLGSTLLHTNSDNQLMEEELILWKLSSMQKKILNDIACNLNWIQSSRAKRE
jgi:hypothetical protein